MADQDTNVEFVGMSVVCEGGFVQCPKCGADAQLRIWGEGCDADFTCPDCEHRLGIR